MKKSLRHNFGLTLIELVVVVSVIGVLSTIIVGVINPLGQLERTRDAIRKTNLRAIANALNAYSVNNNGNYPDPDDPPDSSNPDWLQVLVTEGYLQNLPKDPNQGTSMINSSNNISLLNTILNSSRTYKNIKLLATILQNLTVKKNHPKQEVAGAIPSAWTPFMRGQDQFPTGLSVDPSQPNHAYVSVDVTVPRVTKNGGLTWYIPNDPDFPLYPNELTTWSILVSPHTTGDANRLIFAGGNNGSIFRSSDGESWTKVRPTGGMHISALAADPNNPDVYYAGMGSGHRMAWDYEDPLGGWTQKIFKSATKGSSGSWTSAYQNSNASSDPLTSIPVGATTFSIDVKPTDSNTIFVSNEKGLYKSTNGGTSFVRVTVDSAAPDQFVGDVEFDPASPNKMWAALRELGVFFSDNGGSTWSNVNAGLDFSNQGRYFGFQRLLFVNHGGGVRKLYTTNSGETRNGGGLWTTNLGPNDEILGWTKLTRWGDNINDNGQTIRGMWYVDVPKTNTERLWIGIRDGNIYRSDDRGVSWSYVSAKEKVLQEDIDSQPTTYYENTGIGLEGLEWMTVDPHDASRIYVGDTDHGLFVSVDGGVSERQLFQVTLGNGAGVIAVDPADKNKLYLGSFKRQDQDNVGGIYYSINRGKNWTVIGGGFSDVNGLPIGNVLGLQVDNSSPTSNRVLIAAVDGKGIYKGRFNGPGLANWTWIPFGLNWTPQPGMCRADNPGTPQNEANGCSAGLTDLKADPINPKKMYAVGPGSGFLDLSRAYNVDIASSGIYRCDDITQSSCNWTRVDAGLDVALIKPHSLAFDAINPARLWIAGEKGVWTRNPFTFEWHEIKRGTISVSDARSLVAVSENGKSVIYAASISRGVVRSEDMAGFTDFNGVEFADGHTHNLELLKVRAIDLDAAGERLLVSTQGGGSYERQLTLGSTPTSTPTETPGGTPTPTVTTTPAPPPNNYLYIWNNPTSVILWAGLEYKNDPEAYPNPVRACQEIPPEGTGYNYCVVP